MLDPVHGHAEVCVLNESIGIAPETCLEQERACLVVAIEPIAVVGVAVDDAHLIDREGCLVNQVVIEIGNHVGLLIRAE
jgi:hypothetical protein